MGSAFSRCVQNMRSTLSSCSRKQNEDEPMLTSTCESEAHDKYNGPCLDPSVSLIDRCSEMSHGGSESSLVRCDRIEKSEYNCLKSSTSKNHLSHGTGCKGYETLPSSDDTDDHGRCRRFVDRGIQTGGLGRDVSTRISAEGHGLSKEYIIKTYSIKNATPSPTIQNKFLSSNLPRTTEVLEPPSPNSDDGGFSFQDTPQIFRPLNSESSKPSRLKKPSGSSFATPMENLLHRQEEVLKRLEDLQNSVTQMAEKYHVSSSSTVSKEQRITSKGLGSTLHDIVISVDPSSVPLSLIIMCEQLSKQYTVFQSTYVHSSVSGHVPDNLLQLLTSNGGTSRVNSQISVMLVWKKVTNGPHLVVDPTRQTPILGEANIIRYLARLQSPSYDEKDIISATQTDDFLDLAQLQLIEGSSKEKAAAVRALNSALGKKSWLVGEQLGIADYVCWSALQQVGLSEGAPTNVKKWLGLCNSNASFKSALRFVS